MDSFLYICPLFVCDRSCVGFACAGLACVLAWISFVDVRERIISQGALFGAAAIWCALVTCTAVFDEGASAFRAALAGAAGACVLGLGSLLTSHAADRIAGRETLGAGDVKLLFVVGLFSGAFWGAIVLVLACMLLLGSALVRACYGFLRRRRSACEKQSPRNTFEEGTFPFAPYVSASVLVLSVAAHMVGLA